MGKKFFAVAGVTAEYQIDGKFARNEGQGGL